MDVVCINCGEPWDIDHVLHEDPAGFERQGAAIRSCPCCKGKKPKLSAARREQLEAIGAVAELLGDDLDGLAATLEDFGLV